VNAAEPPTADHNIGTTAASRAPARGAVRSNPAVRIVVGHGTPNVGIRGYERPVSSPIPG